MFTKYDQFLCNVEMDVFDDPVKYPGKISEEAEKRFQEHYLGPLGKPLGKDPIYVCLKCRVQTYILTGFVC